MWCARARAIDGVLPRASTQDAVRLAHGDPFEKACRRRPGLEACQKLRSRAAPTTGWDGAVAQAVSGCSGARRVTCSGCGTGGDSTRAVAVDTGHWTLDGQVANAGRQRRGNGDRERRRLCLLPRTRIGGDAPAGSWPDGGACPSAAAALQPICHGTRRDERLTGEHVTCASAPAIYCSSCSSCSSARPTQRRGQNRRTANAVALCTASARRVLSYHSLDAR
jgi:hypothetical protein